MARTRWPAGALLLLLALTACTDHEAIRRQQVMSQIRELETERAPIARVADEREARIAALETALQQKTAELQDYRDRVKAYMLNHKMAIAVIAAGTTGGAVALSDDNSFSEDARAIGGVVGFVAALWAIGNAEEVAEVLDQMVQANARVKDMEAQIARDRGALTREQQQIGGERERMRALTAKIAELRAQL